MDEVLRENIVCFRVVLKKQSTVRSTLLEAGNYEQYAHAKKHHLKKVLAKHELLGEGLGHRQQLGEIDELLRNYMDVCNFTFEISLLKENPQTHH